LEGETLELIGRQKELELVATALDDARAGRARSLALVGEPGIGKSTLLDAAAQAAVGFATLRVVGAQSESGFPYAGLLALVRPLQDDLGGLPRTQRDSLQAVLTTDLAGVEAFAVSAGLLTLLTAAAERRPLLVLVDDVQWLDDPTRDALGFVLRRLGADSVAVVLAARPDGLGELARVVEVVVDVAPIDDVSAAAILAMAAESLDGTARSAVLAAAHGNPLALLELPHRLSVEQREGREPLPPTLVAGALVELAFAQTAAGLPRSSRTALALAALLEEGGIDLFETAAAQLGVSLGDLEPVEAEGMITLSSGRMTFRHPLVRAAVIGAVDDPTLRDIHRAIAEVLPPGERRALHCAEATVGTDDEAAAELIAAADDVPAVTGAALLTRAAELLADTSERARVLGEAAQLAALAGRLDQATSLVERGLALDPPDRVRGALLVASGRIACMNRAPVDATALLLDGVALLEIQDRAEAVSALADAFSATLISGSVTTTIVERILGLADRSEPTERVFADLVSGISSVQLGRPDEGERVLRGLLSEPQRAGPASRLQDAGVIAALWLYDYPRALEEAASAIESARAAGHLSRLPQLLQFQGFAEARSGRLAAAYAAASEAVSLAEELGQVVLWSDAVNTLAGLEARLGLHDRCQEHVALAIDRCAALGLDWVRGHAMCNLALSEVALGRSEHAVELVEEVHGLLRGAGVKDPNEFAYETLVEALVQLGRDDAAATAVAEMEALFAAVGRPPDDALAVRCTALVAGDDRAPALFERAISLHPDYGPFELSRTHLLYGERLRRMGQRRAARDELRAALELFERLGADWWADRCRRELAASGARLRTLDATTRDELTPQELQVALQVARGLSNREIAQTLFLSPKTIEFHLTRIYRKLDLNARAELVERFAGQVESL
jgi:DNA-binding CsgD family transcriptional regulator